jgi:hypothetical protein
MRRLDIDILLGKSSALCRASSTSIELNGVRSRLQALYESVSDILNTMNTRSEGNGKRSSNALYSRVVVYQIIGESKPVDKPSNKFLDVSEPKDTITKELLASECHCLS